MLGHYGSRPGLSIPLFDSVRESAAYQVLTHLQRCVLRDYLRTYYGASAWDTIAIPEGLIYTFAQCTEPVSRKCFYAAVKRLVKVGFMNCPPEIQEGRALAPRRFLPSEDWKEYVPTSSEAAKLRKLQAENLRNLSRDQGRRARFRAGLSNRTAKRSGQKDQDMSGQKDQDTKQEEGATSGQKDQDTTPENAPAEWTKRPGLTIAIHTRAEEGGEQVEEIPEAAGQIEAVNGFDPGAFLDAERQKANSRFGASLRPGPPPSRLGMADEQKRERAKAESGNGTHLPRIGQIGDTT